MKDKVIPGVRVADTFLTRFRGWMFYRPAIDEALLLDPCGSIHAFFMLVRFDAVFLDRENRILRIIEAIRPWSGPYSVSHAVRVLEIPEGRSRALGLAVGDLVRLES